MSDDGARAWGWRASRDQACEVRQPDCSPLKQGADMTQHRRMRESPLKRQPGHVTDTLLDFTASLPRLVGGKKK